MIAWALLIVLSDPRALPHVSWHPTQQACEARVQQEFSKYVLTNQGVMHVECMPRHMPRLSPITNETLN